MLDAMDYGIEGHFGPYSWPVFALMIGAIFVLSRALAGHYQGGHTLKPSPKGLPPVRNLGHMPFVGSAFRFFSRRRDMLLGKEDFSFFVGKKHIVNLGSLGGRKTFFENKNLSLSQGAIELLAGLVSASDDREDYGAQDFIRSLLALLRPSLLTAQLPVLTNHVRDFNAGLEQAAFLKTSSEWRVLDPFESMYTLTFKLIMQVVGVREWVDDEAVLKRILRNFIKFEDSCSRARIIFSWLITFTHLKKLYYGALLYMSITKVIRRRKEGGARENDAIQSLLDENKDIPRFLFSVISSGITTEACSAAWLTVFLAHSPEWQARCRREVDSVVVKRRTSEDQAGPEILRALSLNEWESEFPTIVAAFRETVRLSTSGAIFRKNTSGQAIAIGGTGEIIPDGAYAAFLMDNVHMDPVLYPEPSMFNPGRFIAEKDGSEKQGEKPHTFVGWGSGRHVCPGMRLAKLEITIVIAHLLLGYQLESSDRDGLKSSDSFPTIDRNAYRLGKPSTPIYLRYKARE